MEESSKPWDFYTCDLCFYRSRSIFLIYKHLRQHGRRSETDTFKCESHAPEAYDCEHCVFKADVKVALQHHLNAFREEKVEDFASKRTLQCYQCGICNFQTHSLLILTQHVYTRNHIITEKSNFYKCEQCSFWTTRGSAFRSHVRLKHSSNADICWLEYGKSSCKVRQKRFLKRHVRNKRKKTLSIKWYECDQCSYRSKYEICFKRHMFRAHKVAGDNDWLKCEQCGYRTMYQNNFKEHISRIHTKNWCTCTHCSFRTKHQDILRSHVLINHRENGLNETSENETL